MQKKMNKKGFTIVELVIVIAVIAILAAVLIPTFVSLVRDANISNDTMVAKNLNTALAAGSVEKAPENFDDVIEILTDGGFLIANLNPSTDDCYFVWESSTNQILLVDGKADYEVLYSAKEGYAAIGNTWYFAINDPEEQKTVETALSGKGVQFRVAVSNSTDINKVLNASGKNIVYVDDSLIVNEASVFVMSNSEADVTIKLGDSVVTGNNNAELTVNNVPFYVESGKLTIEGGTISATGAYLDADNEPVDTAIYAAGGELNLKDVTLNCAGKEIILAYVGATGTVSNTKVVAKSTGIGAFAGANIVVENCVVDTDNFAVFVSDNGGKSSGTIKGGKYSCVGNTIVSQACEIVIEGGEFSATQTNVFKFTKAGSSIVIKGGTFSNANHSNVTFDKLTVEILKDMMAGSSANYAGITVTKNADGSFTIAN